MASRMSNQDRIQRMALEAEAAETEKVEKAKVKPKAKAKASGRPPPEEGGGPEALAPQEVGDQGARQDRLDRGRPRGQDPERVPLQREGGRAGRGREAHLEEGDAARRPQRAAADGGRRVDASAGSEGAVRAGGAARACAQRRPPAIARKTRYPADEATPAT